MIQVMDWLTQYLFENGMAGGLLAGFRVELFDNTPTLAHDNVVGDFDIPTFGGYAENYLGPGSGSLDGAGVYHQVLPQATFTKTDGGSSTVNGYFVRDSFGGGNLMFAEYFPSPVVLTAPVLTLLLDIDLTSKPETGL